MGKRTKGKIPAIENCTFKAVEASWSLAQATNRKMFLGAVS